MHTGYLPLNGVGSILWAWPQPRIVTFIFYAALFMFGRFGIIELSMEQIVYAYCDSTVKVPQRSHTSLAYLGKCGKV